MSYTIDYDVPYASEWRLASDGDGPKGESLHADYFASWDEETMNRVVRCNVESRRECQFVGRDADGGPVYRDQLPERFASPEGETLYRQGTVLLPEIAQPMTAPTDSVSPPISTGWWGLGKVGLDPFAQAERAGGQALAVAIEGEGRVAVPRRPVLAARPTGVVARVETVDALVQEPADVADAEPARSRVKARALGVPEPAREHLGGVVARVSGEEGVVGRPRAVAVDAEDLARQVLGQLGVERLRVGGVEARAVAGADVDLAVGPVADEREGVAAVVDRAAVGPERTIVAGGEGRRRAQAPEDDVAGVRRVGVVGEASVRAPPGAAGARP